MSDLPWEKRKGESVQAYAAFSAYLLMGPTRSLAKLGQNLGKSTKLMGDWSVKWEWGLRVSAYEEHFTLKALDASEDERIEMLREHLRLSSSVLRRARARLEHAVEMMPTPTGDQAKDLETLEMLKEHGQLMTIDQAIRAADLAVKVGRLATGLDGKYVPSGQGSTDLSALDDEELAALEALLEKAGGK